MARGKASKKESLSIEERLEQALVPDWEQPCKVPSNWVWTRLDNVALYKKGPFGSSITKAMFVPKGEGTFKIYEQGNAIRKDKNYGSYYITREKFEELKGFEVFDCDIIVSCAGTIGETFQITKPFEKGIINQALMRIKLFPQINQKYYLYYFDESIQGDIVNKSKGTAIKNIPPFAVLKKLPIPLPPLAEQQRIVDRIENLFSKLDEAKEKVQAALDSFENRKAAILHQAFTGKLTKKWREENGVGLDSWEVAHLKAVSKISSGGTPSRTNPDYYLGNIPWLKTGEIFWNYIHDSEEKITTEALQNSSAKVFPIGTVVVAMYGMGVTRGRAGILAVESASNQAVCALIPNENLKNKFLFYYFMSNYENFRAQSVGGNQLNLSGKLISQFAISLPTVPEQTEIVRILDSIFEKEQQAKELASVIEKIGLMKKAILARAFRGELGTNDPNEESAMELLKTILEV